MSQLTTPDQLGDWIESLLAQVETRLDERNKQVAARMNDMSDRIDALESSIQGTSIPPLTTQSSSTPRRPTASMQVFHVYIYYYSILKISFSPDTWPVRCFCRPSAMPAMPPGCSALRFGRRPAASSW